MRVEVPYRSQCASNLIPNWFGRRSLAGVIHIIDIQARTAADSERRAGRCLRVRQSDESLQPGKFNESSLSELEGVPAPQFDVPLVADGGLAVRYNFKLETSSST